MYYLYHALACSREEEKPTFGLTASFVRNSQSSWLDTSLPMPANLSWTCLPLAQGDFTYNNRGKTCSRVYLAPAFHTTTFQRNEHVNKTRKASTCKFWCCVLLAKESLVVGKMYQADLSQVVYITSVSWHYTPFVIQDPSWKRCLLPTGSIKNPHGKSYAISLFFPLNH